MGWGALSHILGRKYGGHANYNTQSLGRIVSLSSCCGAEVNFRRGRTMYNQGFYLQRGLCDFAPLREIFCSLRVRRRFGWRTQGETGTGQSRYSAVFRIRGIRAYFGGRDPVIRMSTSLLALCCQSGLDATWATPTRARSRSSGSRSLRMSPLRIARFTKARRASWTCA